MTKKKKCSAFLAAAVIALPLVAISQDRNEILGMNAGAGITTGDDNVMIGYDAGRTTDLGSRSVFIGSQAGIGSLDTSGGQYLDSGATLIQGFGESNAIVIGYRAGWQSFGAADSIFIGYRSGEVTTGDENTYIGHETGLVATTSFDLVLIGDESGKGMTTGYENTFIENLSGRDSLDGFKNVAVGYVAGLIMGDNGGFLNAGAGHYALRDTGTGWKNTGFGGYAGEDIGLGFLNTMVGANNGNATEWSDYNTFVGAYAGNENNRGTAQNLGSNNTAVGAMALAGHRQGNNNVFVGAFADSSDIQFSSIYSPFNLSDFMNSGTLDYAGGTLGSNRDPIVDRVTAIGAFTYAIGDDSVSIGYEGTATGLRSINIGSGSTSTHDDALAIGFGAQTHGNGIFVIGNATTSTIDPGVDGMTTLGSPAYRYSSIVSENFPAIADATEPAFIEFRADAGNQVDDEWRIVTADSGALSIQTRASGLFTDVMKIENNGEVTITGEMSTNSDVRLKRDIAELNNGKKLVASLTPKTYKWKAHLERGCELHYGLLANEVESGIPAIVSTGEDEIQSVNYQELIPVLIATLRELQKENAEQKETLERLREEAKVEFNVEQELAELKAIAANQSRMLTGIETRAARLK